MKHGTGWPHELHHTAVPHAIPHTHTQPHTATHSHNKPRSLPQGCRRVRTQCFVDVGMPEQLLISRCKRQRLPITRHGCHTRRTYKLDTLFTHKLCSARCPWPRRAAAACLGPTVCKLLLTTCCLWFPLRHGRGSAPWRVALCYVYIHTGKSTACAHEPQRNAP